MSHISNLSTLEVENSIFENKHEEFYNEKGEFDPTLDKGHNDNSIYLKVPVELRTFEVPTDPKKFFSELLPNMKVLVMNQLFMYKHHQKEMHAMEIIGDFMIYIMGTASEKNGSVPRYSRYDAKKYSKIPYYRWIFNTLGFFVKTFKHKEYLRQKEQNMTYSLDQSSSFGDDENADYMMNRASAAVAEQNNPHDYAEQFAKDEIMGKIRKSIHDYALSLQADGMKNDYENMVHIYDAFITSSSKAEISQELKIDQKIVSKNISKIKQYLSLHQKELVVQLRAA